VLLRRFRYLEVFFYFFPVGFSVVALVPEERDVGMTFGLVEVFRFVDWMAGRTVGLGALILVDIGEAAQGQEREKSGGGHGPVELHIWQS